MTALKDLTISTMYSVKELLKRYLPNTNVHEMVIRDILNNRLFDDDFFIDCQNIHQMKKEYGK